ncbi:hypothetical protein C7E15_00750 [Stenotrophomonas maltophilia]|uniref:hypothetical protein n=1 Tax=Stenotrophomonas maltophilia group TaxID=995085 RepID=UPI000D4D86BE|nr:hypothetical protein [Stenotrophomonas maltophilia]MCF3498164.1 hypothetical protein [Stenotrophomonas maltophilia]PSD21419.1 hypothetical protein C7E15_00750 [Stenotrophomonas maltophilia]UGB23596.1 hypothetical protein LQ335_10285 [Stenotrophomonas maltophilia]
MKVQMQRQAIRLRLDEEELARLLVGESVENMTRLGGDYGWGVVLSLHAGEQAVVLSAGEYCRLALPREAIRTLAARLPCRDGLGFSIALDDISLQIQFDVDVRDSLRQRGPHRRAPSVQE